MLKSIDIFIFLVYNTGTTLLFLGVFVMKKHVLLALAICFIATTSTACVSSDQSSKDQGTVSIKSSEDSGSKDSAKDSENSDTTAMAMMARLSRKLTRSFMMTTISRSHTKVFPRQGCSKVLHLTS